MITEKEIKSWLDCIGVPEECKQLLERLLKERDAYREVAFCRFNDLDDAAVYSYIDAEAARITKEKEVV